MRIWSACVPAIQLSRSESSREESRVKMRRKHSLELYRLERYRVFVFYDLGVFLIDECTD